MAFIEWRTLRGARCAAGIVLLSSAAAVQAGCTRPIVVPVAPVGISVIMHGGTIDGIYPTLLKKISEQTGCQFVLSAVPRARLEAMFEAGTADLMLPSVGTPHRNLHGQFVALLSARAMLLSVDHQRAPVHSLKELLQRRELRVVAVRGNDYGEDYLAALAALKRQGRLYLESDPLQVARLLGQGLADVTILTPMSLSHAMQEDARVKPLLPKLRFEELPELPWHESGVYISKRSLSPDEQRYLAAQLKEGFNADAVWAQYKRYYPANVMAVSGRPRTLP